MSGESAPSNGKCDFSRRFKALEKVSRRQMSHFPDALKGLGNLIMANVAFPDALINTGFDN